MDEASGDETRERLLTPDGADPQRDTQTLLRCVTVKRSRDYDDEVYAHLTRARYSFNAVRRTAVPGTVLDLELFYVLELVLGRATCAASVSS